MRNRPRYSIFLKDKHEKPRTRPEITNTYQRSPDQGNKRKKKTRTEKEEW